MQIATLRHAPLDGAGGTGWLSGEHPGGGGWMVHHGASAARTQRGEWTLELLAHDNVLVQPGFFYDFDSKRTWC